MTMTLALSTLQIRRHEYSGDLNTVILAILVGIGTLPRNANWLEERARAADAEKEEVGG
ncbi:hypothetical protein MTR_5g004890 [Medicago truncatula]|uniref:Uncharacterized protein n=1 Tax=Medicago truncatula TaxID=3880 RepID=G7ZVA1_MEDTR|nr:hypothetical protein MTR_5g004890 [Medicago truncatula]